MSSVMTEVISFVEASALSPEASPFSPVVVLVEASAEVPLAEVPLAKVSVAPFMVPLFSVVSVMVLSPEASPFSPVVVPVEASVEVPLAKVAPFMVPLFSVVSVMVLFVVPAVPFVAPLMVPAAPCDSAPEASVDVLPAEAFVFSPEDPSVPFSPFESEDSEGPAAP